MFRCLLHVTQASLPVMRFSDGKPHYLWVPLHSTGIGRKSVGHPSIEPDSHALGELHVRVQWSHEESEEAAEALPAIAADLALCGVGMSFVDASFLRMPREVPHHSHTLVLTCADPEQNEWPAMRLLCNCFCCHLSMMLSTSSHGRPSRLDVPSCASLTLSRSWLSVPKSVASKPCCCALSMHC